MGNCRPGQRVRQRMGVGSYRHVEVDQPLRLQRLHRGKRPADPYDHARQPAGRSGRTRHGRLQDDMSVVFDYTENWNTTAEWRNADWLDARTVATHEFGHWMGLDHAYSYDTPSSDPAPGALAVMCDYCQGYGIVRRVIRQDDINGLKAARQYLHILSANDSFEFGESYFGWRAVSPGSRTRYCDGGGYSSSCYMQFNGTSNSLYQDIAIRGEGYVRFPDGRYRTMWGQGRFRNRTGLPGRTVQVVVWNLANNTIAASKVCNLPTGQEWVHCTTPGYQASSITTTRGPMLTSTLRSWDKGIPMKKRDQFVGLALALLVATAACGGREKAGVTAAGAEGPPSGNPNGPGIIPPPESEGYQKADPTYPLTPGEGKMVSDWVPAPNFPAFVKWSDAAVTGRVTAITPSRWNTPNAEADFAPSEPDKPMAWMYRDVSLVVDEVVYESPKLPARRGQTITVRLMGDGTENGEEVHGAGPVKHLNALSGPVAVGDRVLWVMTATDFKFTDNRGEPAVRLTTDYFGAWRIGTSLVAESLEARRTVPLAALVAKLRAERATPTTLPTSAQFRGQVNPLE